MANTCQVVSKYCTTNNTKKNLLHCNTTQKKMFRSRKHASLLTSSKFFSKRSAVINHASYSTASVDFVNTLPSQVAQSKTKILVDDCWTSEDMLRNYVKLRKTALLARSKIKKPRRVNVCILLNVIANFSHFFQDWTSCVHGI